MVQAEFTMHLWRSEIVDLGLAVDVCDLFVCHGGNGVAVIIGAIELIVEVIDVEEPGGKKLGRIRRLLGRINSVEIEDIRDPVFLWNEVEQI